MTATVYDITGRAKGVRPHFPDDGLCSACGAVLLLPSQLATPCPGPPGPTPLMQALQRGHGPSQLPMPFPEPSR